MRKVLGLDIGVTSIGWALVNEPENDSESYSIAKMGVRIIPLNPDESDEFTKGNAISKNANRRIKRGLRRGGYRYKMRKQKLTSWLLSMGMMPEKSPFSLSAVDLYGLRNKALRESVTLQELGRIFYHLNQKRGYKSNRKANNEEKESVVTSKPESLDNKQKKVGYLDKINLREEAIKSEEITVGQYFYRHLLENFYFRIKENIFLRKSYEEEFTKIWNHQKTYYPSILTESNFKKVFNEIIYFQRPLKSQRALISNCRFEKNALRDKSGKLLRDEQGHVKITSPKAIAKSNPLFQIAKIWQDVNHLKIRDKSGNNIELSIEQKKLLFDELNEKNKLSVTELKKKLGLTPSDNYYINLKKDQIEGNKTLSPILKILNGENTQTTQFNLVITQVAVPDQSTGEAIDKLVIDRGFEKEPLYRLWHLIYSVEETEHLVKNLKEDFGFTEQQALALAKIDFSKGGYGSISAKAYRYILPHLMNGLIYDKACLSAGYNHSDSMTTEQNLSRNLLDKLELYSKNTLRNPVVEKIVNQTINLVNAIIAKESGLVTSQERTNNKFEIRVELGRELKQNAEERNNTFTRNSKQNKRHEEIRERLQRELGFSTVSRRDIEKVKLWEEFGFVSPYKPKTPISLKELFSGSYDIEHIIPKSRLFDDSYANKTIADRHFNSKIKDNQTAYDCMTAMGEQQFLEYTEFVKQHFYKKDGISRTKLNYLLMQGDKIPQDFINRQMRETAYISREVKNLLQNICYNVQTSSGSVTDYLRESWGINNILQQLNFEKYKTAGLTEFITITKEDGSEHVKEVIKKENWSKRDDHRHHAIDALVVALTTQSIIQKLNSLNQNYQTQRELKESGKKFPEPWKGFVRDATVATQNILVSFKSGKKVATKNINKIKKGKLLVKEQDTLTPRGFLHKETVYGQIKVRKPIDLSPKFNQWDLLAHQHIKKELQDRLDSFGGDHKKAFKDSEKNPIPEHLKVLAIYRKEFVVRYNIDPNFKAADAEFIVDEQIKKQVEARLLEFNNNPKEAFRNLNENPIWQNHSKKIPIKAVRCFTGLSDLTPLHKNSSGEPIDFVSTRNNHHIAIYADPNNDLHENVVSFWDALERKKNNLPTVVRSPKETWNLILETGLDKPNILNNLPKDDWRYITSFSVNECFVFNILKEDIGLLSEKDLSERLYRVQKISSNYYTFRHHLETRVDDKNFGGEMQSKEIGRLITIRSLESFKEKNPIKVKINNLGAVVSVE